MSKKSTQPTILVLSQVYVPDPAAVGQHMAEAAEELAKRGYYVRVLTSGRGYEDPSIKYPSRETQGGVDIIRLPFSSFGKKTILHRLVGQLSFLFQIIVRGIFTPRLGAILVSTSPPMCSFAALVIGLFRRTKIKYWVMDINPDQLIAMGKVKEKDLAVKIFNWLNRRILARADDVVVLDRFMADRILTKRDIRHKLAIIPPGPLEGSLEACPPSENPFIKKHHLEGKRVFMYSGNHSNASPLTTILNASIRLKDQPEIHFMFVGGGHGKQEVEETLEKSTANNITSLPYQPLSDLCYSLPAADVHIVALGDNMVGIIHPCKVYGAMGIARPILYLGPKPSHVSDLIEEHNIGWSIEHGDIDSAEQVLREIADTPTKTLEAMGQEASEVISENFSQEKLCQMFCDRVQRGLPAALPERSAD